MKGSKAKQSAQTGTEVARQIRAFIEAKKLQAGDRLPTHQKLSKTLRIGLRRLREGLGVLGHLGLIATNRKGGTIISAVGSEALHEPIAWHLDDAGCTFEDLVRARAAVESAVAAEAARRPRARDLLVLLDAVEQIEAAAPGTQKHDELDEAFHLAILHTAQNPALELLGEVIDGQFRRKRETGRAWARGHRAQVNTEHRAIFTAIQARDPARARDVMYRHIASQIQAKPRPRRARRLIRE